MTSTNRKADKETRKNKRAYTKCRKHIECRNRPDSIWKKK